MSVLLIRSIAEFALFTDVNANMKYEALKPFIQAAQDQYIVPIISLGEYTTIANELAEVDYPSPPALSQRQLELWEKAQRALAYYTMYKALPYFNTQISNNGLQQIGSREGTAQPVTQWRYHDRMEASLKDADFFAEEVLKYLEVNQASFTQWASSSSYTQRKDLFIASAEVMNQYVNINYSRSTYLALRPFIELAEVKYISPVIGRTYFTTLKSRLLSNTLTSADNAALAYLRRALAYATITEALPQLSVDLSSGITTRTQDDGIHKKTPATIDQFNVIMSSNVSNRDTFLASFKKFMIENRTSYSLYINSEADEYNQPNPTSKNNYLTSGHFRV